MIFLPLALVSSLFSLSPVYADAIPGQFVPDPGRLDWDGVIQKYDDSGDYVAGGAGPQAIFDIPLTGYKPVAAKSSYANWNGAPKGWNPPGLNVVSVRGGGGNGNGNGNNNGNNQQNGGNGSGNNGCGNGNGGPNGRRNCGGGKPPKPPKPPIPQPGVPGPLPILGLSAAFAYSRKLRQRIGK